MKVLKVILLISLVASSAFSQSEPADAKSTLIAGTRVSLIPPAGFSPSSAFPGYEYTPLGSSIMVVEFPAPSSEVVPAFADAAALAQKGMLFLNKEQVMIKGQTGVLVKVKQNAGGVDYVKWILIVGDEKEAVMIVATTPQSHENELSERMRASLLTASWHKDKTVSTTEGLNFTFQESGDLKVAKRMANLLMITRSGVFPSKDVHDPLFIIGHSISKIEQSDLEVFAKSRILQTTSVTQIEVAQSNKVMIDNLDGYELIAEAKDVESREPMLIYQTMLFESGSYYILQGLISEKNSQTYLPVFKEMARSFQRKK